MAKPSLRWFPLCVGRDYSARVKAAIDGASGAYAIRTKRGGGVVYVGESHVGRMWRTLLRHFQTDNFRGDLPRFKRPQDYEVAWRVTSRGKRSKADGDERAMALQARWIEAFKGHLHNKDDGQAGDDSFEFGANVEPEGAFDSVLNPADLPDGSVVVYKGRTYIVELGGQCFAIKDGKRHGRGWRFPHEELTLVDVQNPGGPAKPRALVAPGKVRELASGELEPKEQSKLFLSLLASADRASDRELREHGDRALANARNEAARADVRAANDAGRVAAIARRDREIAALRVASREAAPRAGSYEHELSVMRGRANNPGPRGPSPRGALTALGVLTRLSYADHGALVVELAWNLRDAPVLSVDEAGRLYVVYAGRVVRASSPAEVKDYRRLHWGAEGRGEVRDGGISPAPFVDLGGAQSVTYTTKKGVDASLVDYVHPFGEGSSRALVRPRVVVHVCRGGCAPKCAARGAIALLGGSYTVETRGIVG